MYSYDAPRGKGLVIVPSFFHDYTRLQTLSFLTPPQDPCLHSGVRIEPKAITHTMAINNTWKESVLAETDPTRLVAFASYAAGSLSSRELDAAQTHLRRLPTEGLIDLFALRNAALKVAQEANDLIAERRFFGDRSVSTEGWEAWWASLPQAPETQPEEKRYYIIHRDDAGNRTFTSDLCTLKDAVKLFTTRTTYDQRSLYYAGLEEQMGQDRLVAYYSRGAPTWAFSIRATEQECQTLQNHRL